MGPRLRPWITAALLGLAALLPYAMSRWAGYRLTGREQLIQTFVEPFRGKARGPFIQRRETPPPPVPLREPEPEAPPGLEAEPAAGGGPGEEAGPMARKRGGSPAPAPVDGSAFLSDPQNELRRFQEALSKVEHGEGLVRVLHFGDSVVTGDLITGEARARLQHQFGDGGPGWIYAQRPWEWYGRPGLSLKGRGWRIHCPVLTWRKDGLYGLGGVEFTSNGGAETQLSTAASEPFSTLELHLLGQPRGGRIQVKVDKGTDVELDGTGAGPILKALPMPSDAPHSLLIRAKGELSLHGIVLERKGPGVVYDAIGSNGGTVHQLASIQPQHWIQALRLRRPDLVVLAFGTNETGYYNIPGPAYAADYREVVRRIREALPQASILVMGPMDRGERKPDGSIGTMPKLVQIVEAQRKIAAELGLAFFDTYRAMGGEGTAGRWYHGTPRLMTGDFTHPTRTGADRIAAILVDALTRKYQAWKGSAAPAPRSGGGKP